MTTSVFIRNDSPDTGSGSYDVFVGVRGKGQPKVYPSTARPLKPGDSVTTTVYADNELIIREVEHW